MVFQLSESDLAANDELLFKDKEVVKFVILDVRENATNGNLILKVKALSSEHAGKECEIFITTKDNPASKKRRAQFFNAFIATAVWSKQALIAGTEEIKKILGHVITAQSECRAAQGKTFQNWSNIQDEGFSAGASAAPAAGASPASPGAAVTY